MHASLSQIALIKALANRMGPYMPLCRVQYCRIIWCKAPFRLPGDGELPPVSSSPIADSHDWLSTSRYAYLKEFQMTTDEVSALAVVENLFSAPFLRLQWPDATGLNEQLKSLILDKSIAVDSVRQSNKGGWQSAKDLQNWNEACVERFLAMAALAISKITSSCVGEDVARELEGEWKISAWANVNRYSNYNGLHAHVGGFWSGVYYVSAGKANDSCSQEGWISFRNPTIAPLAISNLQPPPAIAGIFRTKFNVKPLDGLMLLFPSWLEHYVHPYFGVEPRISISWDATMSR